MKHYDELRFARQSEQYVEGYQFFRRKKGEKTFIFVGELKNTPTKEKYLVYRCLNEEQEEYEYQIKMMFV